LIEISLQEDAFMGVYDTFGTEEKFEQDGIWLEYGDSKFLVARAGGSNEKYKKLFLKKTKPHRVAIQNEILTDEVGERLLVELYADAVILDWQNVTDREGTNLLFNRENVIQVLTDLPFLFSKIREECEKVSNFQKEAIRDASEALKKK